MGHDRVHCRCRVSPAEKIVNPIMKNVYQASGAGGSEGGEEEDFGADDL